MVREVLQDNDLRSCLDQRGIGSQAGHRTLSVSEIWKFLESAPLNFMPYYFQTHRKLNR
jgi:hypothetical protein